MYVSTSVTHRPEVRIDLLTFRQIVKNFALEPYSKLCSFHNLFVNRNVCQISKRFDQAPEEHTIDDVIIWDLLTASSNFALWCPFCAECSGLKRTLKPTRWKDGKTTFDQPQRL